MDAIKMDAIVTAGGIPEPGDLLYPYTQGQSKALLEVAGKPMIQWVLDALCGSEMINNIVLVSLDPEIDIQISKPVAYVPHQGGMLANARAGVDKVAELNPESELILMASSDIPAITTEMVDWAIKAAMETEDDVYYNVVTRETMEARYPGSKRSFIKFKGNEVCGADMNVIRASIAVGNDELWNNLIGARKNAFKQAALFGYDTLLLLLLRQLPIESVVKRAGSRMGLRGRAVNSPYAEIAMDVDKPYQLELLRAEMEKKAGV